MSQVLFQMWEPFRKHIISNHRFYIVQSEKRLLSQFQNLEEEADKYAEEWLEQAGQNFDPECDDPGAYYEQANDESIEFYQMLEDMQNQTRLSVIAGMFHAWDKQLRSWLGKEIFHWHFGEEVQRALWKVNFGDIADLLECFGWPIRLKSYFASLDRCRLVVNAYKHGNFGAFDDLKKTFPEFIQGYDTTKDTYLQYADHTDLVATAAHIAEFSDAIIAFWQDVPENVFEEDLLQVPSWFEKALKKSTVSKATT